MISQDELRAINELRRRFRERFLTTEGSSTDAELNELYRRLRCLESSAITSLLLESGEDSMLPYQTRRVG